eukprot:snap_masked-scaffold_5-processed-gene-7.18-mRNA-1 protein AED:1.00 eAED:1.00 QI:0/-1/0/0/-1/1/1/0/301
MVKKKRKLQQKFINSEHTTKTKSKISINNLDVFQNLALKNAKSHHRNIVEHGYTIVRNVFSHAFIQFLLYQHETENISAKNFHNLRKRKANQTWCGVVETIASHIKINPTTKQSQIIAPVTSRGVGRYDLPLPQSISAATKSKLSEMHILEFLNTFIPHGNFTAQNIILSKSGAKRQKIHIDFFPEDKIRFSKLNCAKRLKQKLIPSGYLTVLIPLTKQTTMTGGTRVWPRSHLNWREQNIDEEKGFLDCISPLLNVGDCLLFDGFLAHCGMENKSTRKDRYFYYGAYTNSHDPNTEVTGV